MASASCDEIVRLLEEERGLLLRGDIQAVAALADRKERLLNGLGGTVPPARELRVVEEALKRNARLLSAVARGVRQALEGLRQARNGGPALESYSAGGERRTIGVQAPNVERRA